MTYDLTTKEIKEKYKITNQTLYNWRNSGKIKCIRLPSGKFMYQDPAALNEVVEGAKDKDKHAIYARVSNTKQKEDLDRQLKLLRAYVCSNGGIISKEYFDIASGMNENRESFNILVEDAFAGKITKLYVTYKDRLTRFGFGYLEKMLLKAGCTVVVLNATKEEDFQAELVSDLVSVVHHFSMKLYSNRRKELKKITELLTSSTTTG